MLATNIAETSLTIEDVVYVVDSGKLKVSHMKQSEPTPILSSAVKGAQSVHNDCMRWWHGATRVDHACHVHTGRLQ